MSLSASVTVAALASLRISARGDRALTTCLHRCAKALCIPLWRVREAVEERLAVPGAREQAAATRAACGRVVAEAVREACADAGKGDVGAAVEIERRTA